MATAGTFVVVQISGTWNEVFLLEPISDDGLNWICRTAAQHGGHFYSLVRLVPGAVLPASDLTNKRRYQGLKDEDVYWMCSNEEWTSSAWAPTETSKDNMLQAIAEIKLLGSFPESEIAQAGSTDGTFKDLANYAAQLITSSDVQVGRFAIILRGGMWKEVFLCHVLSADGLKWLCKTTNWANQFYYVPVELVPGMFTIPLKGDCGAGRRYIGVVDDEIHYMCVGPYFCNAWSPSPAEMEASVAEAQQAVAELGEIPQNYFCVAGSDQGGLPSIKEMLEGSPEVAPGKLVLIQRTPQVWREVLLLVQHGSPSHWLCLAEGGVAGESQGGTNFFLTAVQLEPGHAWVLQDSGPQRHAMCATASEIMPMRKDAQNNLWMPPPEMIAKAIEQAQATAQIVRESDFARAGLVYQMFLPKIAPMK